MLEHTDFHLGRLIDALGSLEVLDDTLIYYIIGDNGASAEGTMNGAFNEMANFNGMAAIETPEFMVSKMDELGTPSAYNHYSVGWAWAMNTPFQWTKQVASHWGGTRNGTIVHWPNGIEERGGVRSQFTHVIDVAPTILEAAGLPEPTMVNGVLQSPMEGTSMLYTFKEPDEPERHDLQYFEMFANRGIYYKGWSAVTKHRTPWVMVGGDLPAFDDDVWELYDGTAATTARRATWPLSTPRCWPSCSGSGSSRPRSTTCCPWTIARRTHRTLDGGAAHVDPGDLAAVLPGHGTPVREQRRQHEEQVVLGHRGGRGPRRRCRRRGHRAGRPVRRMGRLRQGQPAHVRLQRARHPVVRDRGGRARADRDPSATHGVRLRRRRPGQGRRRHAVPRRHAGGQRAGRGDPADGLLRRRDHRHRLRVGHDRLPRLHRAHQPLRGRIKWVQLDVGTDDNDHFIDPEERLRVAMARQ